MDAASLKELVCKMFLGGDTSFPIEVDTDLLADGICDSLGLVQLAAELEKRTPGIKIRDQEITRENFATCGSILRFLGTKTK